MSSETSAARPHVAIVGGGLAGLATAVALAQTNCRVELFEARRYLGGRAASFRDPGNDELVDHCQHVGMGCCTNLADFCRRTGMDDLFRRDRELNFIAPDGRVYPFVPSPWLPAPLHLAGAFWGLKYFSVRDRLDIARAIWKLMRMPAADERSSATVGQWLTGQRQSAAAVENFWKVILVSALGEDLDRASLSAARKVILDGFVAARDAAAIDVPRFPLATLYGERLTRWLEAHDVTVRLNSPVRALGHDGKSPVLRLAEGAEIRPQALVLAVPWGMVPEIIDPALEPSCPWIRQLREINSAPITGVHLWFDRPITPLPHAVLVGRLSQWIFRRAEEAPEQNGGHYYQVVISASRMLAGRDRLEIVDAICRELAAIWPVAGEARLLRARVVTQHAAVFSLEPHVERIRPAQGTSLPGVYLAGDWTATGWPSTMEGAVRSGYLAAEAICRALGQERSFLVPDLPRGWLARLLIRD